MRIIHKKKSSSNIQHNRLSQDEQDVKKREKFIIYTDREIIYAQERNNGTTARAREIFVCRNLFLKPLP